MASLPVPEALRVAAGYYLGTQNDDPITQVFDGLMNLTNSYESFNGIDFSRSNMSLELWIRSSEWPAETKLDVRQICHYARAIGLKVAVHEILYTAAEFAPRAKLIVQAGRDRGWTVRVDQRGRNDVGISGPEIGRDPLAEEAMLEIGTRVLGKDVTIEMNPDE